MLSLYDLQFRVQCMLDCFQEPAASCTLHERVLTQEGENSHRIPD